MKKIHWDNERKRLTEALVTQTREAQNTIELLRGENLLLRSILETYAVRGNYDGGEMARKALQTK